MVAEDVVQRIHLFGGGEFPLTRADRKAFTGKAWEALCAWIRETKTNSLYGALQSEGFTFDDMIHEFAAKRARWDPSQFRAIVERLVGFKALLGREDEEVEWVMDHVEFGVHLLKTRQLRHDPNSSLYGPPARLR